MLPPLQLMHHAVLNIAACAGNSLGGYLGGRACAELSDRVAACVIYPARTDLFAAFNVTAQYGTQIYGGVGYVAQQKPSLLPQGYAQAFSNYSSNILEPLLYACTPDTSAPEAFATPLELTYGSGGCTTSVALLLCFQAQHALSKQIGIMIERFDESLQMRCFALAHLNSIRSSNT